MILRPSRKTEASQSLALRIRRSAFILSMLIFVIFGGAWLALALSQIPDTQSKSHLMMVRIIGEVLSNDINNQIDNVRQFSSSSLVWTAMTDTSGREGYLRPFLSPQKSDNNTTRVLLDYRGRVLLGEFPQTLNQASIAPWFAKAQITKQPKIEIATSDDQSSLVLIFPVLHPYSKEFVGAVVGAIDLRETILKRYAGLGSEMGIDLIYQDQILISYPGHANPVYFPVDFDVLLNLRFENGNPILRIFTTSNPWIKPIASRVLLSVVLAFCVGVLVWKISGLIADRITSRLERLVSSCEDISAGLYTQVVEDSGADEIGVLSRTLNNALSSYNQINANLEALVAEKTRNLSQSEARFRAIIEASPIPFALNDDQQNVTYLNAAFMSTFGYTRDDIPTVESWWPKAYPDVQYREKVMSVWQEHLTQADRSNSPFEPVEAEVCCKSGEKKTVLVATESLGKSEGHSHVVSFSDITSRIRAEEQHRLAATVFSHAREGILITDAAGYILDVNAMFSRITGYSRDEVIGKSPRIFSSGRHDKLFYSTMWRDLTEKGYWAGEIWNRRKNGEIYPEMLTIGAVRGQQGQTQQYVALFADITDAKNHEHELECMAHYDALTGLPNRTLLADRLRQAMLQATRRKQTISVCYLDLDGFKSVNDQHGHEVGDRLLIAIASKMKEVLRESDTLARIGGDEFVAILLDLHDEDSALTTIERLVNAVSPPVDLGDFIVQVSASVGVTFYQHENLVDADQLLRQADRAMYQAKSTGKNRYCVFNDMLDCKAVS